MTLHLHFPIPMEPDRAAAKARYRCAVAGQRQRAWKDLRDKTAEALRKTEDKRDG